FIAAQAARVPGLERELARLESERGQVARLAEDLARAEEQYDRVRNLLGVEGSEAEQGVALPPLRGEGMGDVLEAGEGSRPSSWPLARAGFITQRRQVTDAGSHPGLDIAVPADSYIRATASGVVRDAGVDDVYGRYILIDHGDGLESMYGHASRIFVETGDRVERNEVIALSGSTGRSTAPHLHFEIRQDGEALDPLAFVRQPS
ncbi:MAG: peptidoglycan DD-metalloendopeptidase family protein, partial [Gemmatimonadetes bacterium]|nr:M23 family metallopeptidase [Gemmatimonadota bacterium]NIQ59032.1 M23 family metallopeptidase [Gemmatimonadota bacterium]NIU79240.1 peptidoglycan DD-metalloendopeptidase family protein [Gammaproteobacteria bacterium]NIX48718.1 peptidoglycan DD-metalloendopeptidase family protein [Gemmatimonadota bacterium]NIY13169.1 peptidoglycan DD-metalloendopeptidase family protein [Gemmatimonadota bacterium]